MELVRPIVPAIPNLWRKIDLWILIPAVVIYSISAVALYALSLSAEGRLLGAGASSVFSRQLLWGAIGIAAMLAASSGSLDRYRRSAVLSYAIGIALLLAVLFFGIKVRNIRAWLSIGVATFQPSEFMKPLLIISLAAYLAGAKWKLRPVRSALAACAITAVPALLVLKQPDMGTVIVYCALLLSLPFLAGFPSGYFAVVLFSGGLLAARGLLIIANETFTVIPNSSFLYPIVMERLSTPEIAGFVLVIAGAYFLWTRFRKKRFLAATLMFLLMPLGAWLAAGQFVSLLKPYQQERILTFLSPSIDPKGAGYNTIQSEIAFGSGGIFGKEIQGATQSALGFLPESRTDFIFSVIGEIFGLVGAAVILGCYLILLLRLLYIGASARTRFGSLICGGVATVLAAHVSVNIGMALGLLPVMGIPLPLASYGGTALVSTFLMLGLAVAVKEDARWGDVRSTSPALEFL